MDNNLTSPTPLSPLMQKYMGIREATPQYVIVLFRIGDFYEMFNDDAKIAAPILDAVLTKRNQMPTCGIPYHALQRSIEKLIVAGKTLAVIDPTHL